MRSRAPLRWSPSYLRSSKGIQRGWSDPVILIAFAVTAISTVMFIIIERRTDQPLLPMAFFKQRDFTGSMVGMFFIMFALMGVMFYMPPVLPVGARVIGIRERRADDAAGDSDDDLRTDHGEAVTQGRPAIHAVLGPGRPWRRCAVDSSV